MPIKFISRTRQNFRLYLSLFINRILLKTPFGAKVIHRPYHAAPKFSIKNPQLKAESDSAYKIDPNKFLFLNSPIKKLKILTYPWHFSHQYELYKLGHHFTLITDGGSWHTTGWNFDYRPIPPNVEFRSIREVNIKDYDLAILHFDENVLSPNNCNGQLACDWGETFKFFRTKIDLPKIAICHGTPQFYGQYDINYQQANIMEVIELERIKLVAYLSDILVITNSHQAQAEWGFKQSKVIWHGFDLMEFPLTTYAKAILSPFDKAAISRPHYRGYNIYREVVDLLSIEFQPSVLSIKSPPIDLKRNQYAEIKFKNYVNNIREYSIYFNPTIRSPMPRSRGEAMMCGIVTVSLQNHDVDLFIDNKINGFYSKYPEELRDFLLFLCKHPDETRKIGQKSRELAMDIFNSDRYLHEWQHTILSLL